jgi:hypothetical protein
MFPRRLIASRLGVFWAFQLAGELKSMRINQSWLMDITGTTADGSMQPVIGIVIRNEGGIRHGFQADTPFCRSREMIRARETSTYNNPGFIHRRQPLLRDPSTNCKSDTTVTAADGQPGMTESGEI